MLITYEFLQMSDAEWVGWVAQVEVLRKGRVDASALQPKKRKTRSDKGSHKPPKEADQAKLHSKVSDEQ